MKKLMKSYNNNNSVGLFGLFGLLLIFILINYPCECEYIDSSIPKFSVRLVGIFVSDSALPYTLELTQPAIEIAIEKARKQFPLIPWNEGSFRNGSNKCTSNFAGVYAAEEFYSKELKPVTAFIGPACGLALDPVARMASYWDRPIFSAGGIHGRFSNKQIFSTLTRLSISLEGLGNFMKQLLKQFEWKHVVMIVYESNAYPIIQLIRRSLEDTLTRSESLDYEITLDIHDISRPLSKVNLTHILYECSKESRIMILLANGEVVRKMLLAAYDLGMGNGHYAFLTVELFRHFKSFGNFSWFIPGDERNEDARFMYESLLIFTADLPESHEYDDFVQTVIQRSKDQFNSSYEKSDVNIMLAGFHDSILIYGQVLSETLLENGNLMRGRDITSRIWNRTFTGLLSGDIYINENGDKESDFIIFDFDPKKHEMERVIHYSGVNQTLIKLNDIHWPGNSKTAPADIQHCEMNEEDPDCQTRDNYQLYGSVGIIVSLIVVTSLAIAFHVHRKIKFESELTSMWWRVRWNEITIIEGSERSFEGIETSRHIQAQAQTQAQVQQSVQQQSVQQSAQQCEIKIDHHVNASGKANVKHKLLTVEKKQTMDFPSILPRRGMYKGMKVSIKPLNIRRVNLNRHILLELKQLKDLSHENLIRFIGFCPEEPFVSLLTEYSQKGNLRDLLDNEAIRVDWTFRYSLISDIVEGMNFIHESSLHYHGRLKSTNCVVDSRLVVKLTDFGLRSLRNQGALLCNKIDYKSLLWIAPEHLRQKRPELNGSQKGDVYSFAIVLQEIITRTGPFETAKVTGPDGSISVVALDPEFIAHQIRIGGLSPFRPEVMQDDCPTEILEIMRDCWSETPMNRPTFSTIKQHIKKLTKDLGGSNFLENLLLRMEQYANDLEKLVEEKTAAFFEEKRKCEELLYEVLPRYVAEQLKTGHHVRPEAFDCVTVFFSDIVDFEQLSSESTPIEIVEFLNELYTCFDAIIGNYDVYKVETVGDAYLVVSGLPIQNGNEHAREIARMSLALLEGIKRFRVKHLPDRKVKIKIGVHSGSVAAGVIGLKMPRYCIMGDTVNTASRMESHGEPNKIHISAQTKSILDKFGNFKITLRGDIELKGKGIVRTYWLDGEGFDNKVKIRY